MCFRPADANAPTSIDCPKCGKKVNYTNGVLPKKCPFCKTPTSELEEMAASAPAAPAPSAPSTPKAPGAPQPPAE